jgi:4a-hydroxytetrahydrobiopterin dehydratase
MTEHTNSTVLDHPRIAARLSAELPKWRHENGFLRRTYQTANWKGTLMVINTIGHLAEAAWHHPDLAATYASVDVSLVTHDAGGITNKDFALARKIEEVVMWHPVGEGLEGTPRKDPRFAYVDLDA